MLPPPAPVPPLLLLLLLLLLLRPDDDEDAGTGDEDRGLFLEDDDAAAPEPLLLDRLFPVLLLDVVVELDGGGDAILPVAISAAASDQSESIVGLETLSCCAVPRAAPSAVPSAVRYGTVRLSWDFRKTGYEPHCSDVIRPKSKINFR